MRTQFASLEGSHPDDSPVPNTHIVTMDWSRIEFDFIAPLSATSDLELQIPYDIKEMKARYELPDGTPYDNPEGDLHHRTETLEGFSDLRLLAGLSHESWRLSAGVNIPVGEIEDDPYVLGDQGLEHQHVQFGTGTFDPIFRIFHVVHVGDVSLNMAAGGHVPLYENRKGFQAAATYDLNVGPSFRIAEGVGVSIAYNLLYQTRGYWDGEPDENTGYAIQGVHVSVPIEVAAGSFIVPHIYWPFRVDTRTGAETFDLDWIVSVSLELPLGGGE